MILIVVSPPGAWWAKSPHTRFLVVSRYYLRMILSENRFTLFRIMR